MTTATVSPPRSRSTNPAGIARLLIWRVADGPHDGCRLVGDAAAARHRARRAGALDAGRCPGRRHARAGSGHPWNAAAESIVGRLAGFIDRLPPRGRASASLPSTGWRCSPDWTPSARRSTAASGGSSSSSLGWLISGSPRRSVLLGETLKQHRPVDHGRSVLVDPRIDDGARSGPHRVRPAPRADQRLPIAFLAVVSAWLRLGCLWSTPPPPCSVRPRPQNETMDGLLLRRAERARVPRVLRRTSDRLAVHQLHRLGRTHRRHVRRVAQLHRPVHRRPVPAVAPQHPASSV